MQKIRGKKALVTGASSGIGRAIAVALAREGADVYLVGRDRGKLAVTAKLAQGYGVEAVTAICDLSQPDQIPATVKALLARWGGLNILVNNAGTAYYGPMQDMTDAQWQQILAVNLHAPIQLVRALLPTLLAQDEAHIMNVSSIFGLVPMRKGAAYQTTKFALVGFSNGLNSEFGRRNFGVTALCPGFVRTAMLDSYAVGAPGQSRHILPSWSTTTAENVAEKAIRAIYRNQGVVVVSLPAKLFWWLTRIAPNFVGWLMREGWRK